MQRVFILSEHPLFGQGVASLLCGQEDIQVVGQEAEIGKAMEQINASRPNAIVLEHNRPDHEIGLIVMNILKAGFASKVIGLNLAENTLHLYCGEHWEARRVDDLVEAIKATLFHGASRKI